METYISLKDLISKRIGDEYSPYGWGRGIYKYTPCGAWVSFIISEPTPNKCTLNFSRDNNNNLNLQIWNSEGLLLEHWEKLSSFFGFNINGEQIKEKFKTIPELIHLLELYPNRNTFAGDKAYKFSINKNNEEHLLLDVVFQVINESTIYYEDKEASIDNLIALWINKCTGVRIGSIVEGSDYELDPYNLYFPFTEK
jgi:hypothetical protein